MAFDSIFPFLPSNAGSPPQLFPYDVIINTAFPGVEFIGTEPNAEYQEIREVNGSLWLVTNAMWNENLLQWDQESNQNTTLSAYALELNANGSMTRYESPPTLIPMTAITWTPMWTVTGVGLMDSTPLEVTGPSAPMNDLAVTWDPGIGVVLVARQEDITDIASSPNSLLDNLVVNGVQVWAVNKEGVLVAGTVPASAIPGLFNNATFTGTSTFNGPVITNSTFTANGPATFNSSITGNSTLFITGLSTLNGHANINGGETVTGGLTTDSITVTGGGTSTFTNIHVTGTSALDGAVTAGSTLHVVGAATVDGGEIVTGGLTTDTIDVTGGGLIGGTLDTHSIEIAPGNSITINGTTPVVTLESTNGSITIAQVTPTEYNIESNPAFAGNSYPIGGAKVNYGASGTSLIIPSVGTAWNVVCQAFIQYSSTGGANTLNITGTGGTAGGAWTGGTDPVSNLPTTTFDQFTLQLNGFANAGDTVTATVSSSGTISVVTTNLQITAFRVT